MIYRFEDYCLDVGRQELRRGIETVDVEPQVLDLLQYLIRNREGGEQGRSDRARLAGPHRMRRRFDDAIAELEASIRLNPNAHLTYSTLGITKVLAGRGDEALSHFADAIRLSPRDPLLFIGYFGIGWAEFLRANDAQAVDMLRKALALNPGYSPAHQFLTAAYAMQDHTAEAREALAAYLRTNPTANTLALLRAHAQSVHPVYLAQRERLYEGMRRAGLPEK